MTQPVPSQQLGYQFHDGSSVVATLTLQSTQAPDPAPVIQTITEPRMTVGNTTRTTSNTAGVTTEDAAMSGAGPGIRLYDPSGLTPLPTNLGGRLVLKSFKAIDSGTESRLGDAELTIFKHEIDAKALHGEDVPTWVHDMGTLVGMGTGRLAVGVTGYAFEIGRDLTPYLIDGVTDWVVDYDGSSPKVGDAHGTYHDYRRAIDLSVAFADKYGLKLHAGEVSVDYADEDTDGMMRVGWYCDTLSYLEEAGFRSAFMWYYVSQARSVPRAGAEVAAIKTAMRMSA